jgi:hypothetical protein
MAKHIQMDLKIDPCVFRVGIVWRQLRVRVIYFIL